MPFSNFLTYHDKDSPSVNRVGHLDIKSELVTPLAHLSGTPVSSLYEIIEVGSENVIDGGPPVSLPAVTVLPPLPERDVLAVGKNYSEHAKEFNESGYDASDKVDMPSHPVLFTKRATSIIANGQDIMPHAHFTSTLDYEGEIGAIIGKTGSRISEDAAAEYIWGYTIINDVTAREKQRDHKQFYIGKSADTFCPMGPIAVPAQHMPENIEVQTKVNGEARQHGSLKDLIFSIPKLIATLSEAQTLRAGDVIATGTPAGVGFGLKPPLFLKPGDVVEVSVTGLGTLRNQVADYDAINYTETQLKSQSTLPLLNQDRSLNTSGMITLRSGKRVFVDVKGPKQLKDPVVLIHGLGCASTYWTPFVANNSDHFTCIAPDLEGHGLSPISAGSQVTMESIVEDLHDLFIHFKLERASLIGHSLGGQAAIFFAMRYPEKVSKLIVMGPTWAPLNEGGKKYFLGQAEKARREGMVNVASSTADFALAENCKTENPLAYASLYNSTLYTHPEGYAKAATALALAEKEPKVGALTCPILYIAGEDQWTSERFDAFTEGNALVERVILEGVVHCHLIEDFEGCKKALQRYGFFPSS